MDLSWDIVSRFSNVEFPDKTKLPKEFFTDFIKVACDEAKVILKPFNKNLYCLFVLYNDFCFVLITLAFYFTGKTLNRAW